MPLLVVQMGHAGRTDGVTGAPGEQQFTQAVGEACRRLLSGVNGWTVNTIPADPASSAYRGNAFVAVHADGNDNPAVAGASFGYQTDEGSYLAQDIRAAYVALGWVGPWHPDNYTSNLAGYYGVSAAVAQGNRRAVIFECGTITNPTEQAAMTSAVGVDRVAMAIGLGVGILTDLPAPTPNKERDMPNGLLPPRTDPSKPGRVPIALPKVGEQGGQVIGARLHLSCGWGQSMKYLVWCVAEGGGYTNEAGHLPYQYTLNSDQPGWFFVPGNTAQISIQYVTSRDDTDVAWTLELAYAS